MNDRLIKDYRPYLAKLSELSYDREHKVSLIEDEDMSHRMFNFDGIFDKFSKKIRGEKNMSCDGYYEKTSQDTYLVEFKNQEEGKIDKKWLKNKIYDSIATVVMNENVTRTDVAGRVTVIIVYNDANHGEKTDSDYSTSEAFNRFSEKLGELSGRKDVDSLPKKFDLERYKGILFKDVYTVDRRNFEKYFLKILFE